METWQETNSTLPLGQTPTRRGVECPSAGDDREWTPNPLFSGAWFWKYFTKLAGVSS